jgi:O-antigen biosynthesis protein
LEISEIWKTLCRAFDLLGQAAGKVAFKVIVGFNFQGDSDSPSALASEFPEVEQLRASAKLGYCLAYNQLMARSKGRYALLLDDDTTLRQGAIEVMVHFMDAHPEVGIAGCRIVNPTEATRSRLDSCAISLSR